MTPLNRRKPIKGVFAVPVATAIVVNDRLGIFKSNELNDALSQVVKLQIHPKEIRDLFFKGNSPLLSYLKAKEKISSFNGGTDVRSNFNFDDDRR